jgi:hypothetical protein
MNGMQPNGMEFQSNRNVTAPPDSPVARRADLVGIGELNVCVGLHACTCSTHAVNPVPPDAPLPTRLPAPRLAPGPPSPTREPSAAL